MPLGPARVGEAKLFKPEGLKGAEVIEKVFVEVDERLAAENPNYRYYKCDVPVDLQPDGEAVDFVAKAYKAQGWPRVHCFVFTRKAKEPTGKDSLYLCVELGS